MKKLLLGAMLAAACVTTDANARDANTESILKMQMGSHYQGPISDVNTSVVGLADTFSKWTKDSTFKENKKQLKDAASALKKIAKFTESIMNGDKEKNINKKEETAVKAADTFKSSMSVLKSTPFWTTCGGQLKDTVRDITSSLQSLAQKDVKVKVAGSTYSPAEGLNEDGGVSAQYDESDPRFLALDNGQTKISRLLTKFEEICTIIGVDIGSSNTTGQTVTVSTSTSTKTSKR